MKKTKVLASVAYHEAGHAVAAFEVGLRTRKLSIIPEDGSLGRHEEGPYFTGINMEHDTSPRYQRRLENMALVCLVGPAAQRRFNPKGYRHYHASGDHQEVSFFLSLTYLSGNADVLDAHVKLIAARARAFVETPAKWVAIEALASVLLDRKEIPGREVAPIIRAALKDRFGIDPKHLGKPKKKDK